MKKIILFKHFEGAANLAAVLKYAHRNTYYYWPDVLTDRIYADVIRRMKAGGLSIPKSWPKDK